MEQVSLVREALVVSGLLGFLFSGVDLLDGRAEQNVVEQAVTLVRERDGRPTVWYIGCGGFEFYAERAGMKPVSPGGSLLRKGDWLVIPDRKFLYSNACLPPDRSELVTTIQVEDVVPLTMMPSYHAGRTPMLHLDGPRASAELYRLAMELVACTPR